MQNMIEKRKNRGAKGYICTCPVVSPTRREKETGRGDKILKEKKI